MQRLVWFMHVVINMGCMDYPPLQPPLLAPWVVSGVHFLPSHTCQISYAPELLDVFDKVGRFFFT